MRSGVAVVVCLTSAAVAAQPPEQHATGARDAAEPALVAERWSAGEALREAGQHRPLIVLDEALLDRFGDHLSVRRRVEVQSRLARSLLAVGRERDARAAFEATLATAVELDAESRAALVDRLGEAWFRIAEAERERALSMRLSPLQTRPTLDKMNRWAASTFAPWLTRRYEATRRAAALYRRVSEPGRSHWEIAAAARTGELWMVLARSFERLPIPAEIARDQTLAAVYADAIDGRVEALRDDARNAFERGLSAATALGVDDAWARRCREGLARLGNP